MYRTHGARGVLTLILVLLFGVTSALAQGMYYKEIKKDDRIYVFNIAANAEKFEQTGQIGNNITMTAAGPNGETLIGDNETALQLFFFKHNMSEVVPVEPAAPPAAPAAVPYKFSGLVFGDYYAFTNSHLPAWENQHGLWLRRIYFTFDYTFSPKITTRFRLEANSNGKLQGGSLNPYVKDAYLRWTYHGRQQVTLGIQPSLTFDYIESVWGLRHIEKTPLDLYRVDSSRDTGITFSGPINKANTVKYAFQYGNESGNNAETDKFKGYRFATRYEPPTGLTAELVLAQFDRDKDADRFTAQGFAAYRVPQGRVGFQVLGTRSARHPPAPPLPTSSSTSCPASACGTSRSRRPRSSPASTASRIPARTARASTTCRSTPRKLSPPRSPGSSTTSTRRSASARTSNTSSTAIRPPAPRRKTTWWPG